MKVVVQKNYSSGGAEKGQNWENLMAGIPEKKKFPGIIKKVNQMGMVEKQTNIKNDFQTLNLGHQQQNTEPHKFC